MVSCGISAAELQQIRSDVASLVCDTPCVIQRKTITRDAYGQSTEAWVTIATVNVGVGEPSSGQLANYDFLIGALAIWKIQMPHGTPVQVQDHLEIAGQEMVVQVDLSPASYNALVTVLASSVK